MEPPWNVGNENLLKCTRSHDQDSFQAHVWKKPSKIFFFRTKRPMTLKLRIQHQVLKYYQIFSLMTLGWRWPFLWQSDLFPNASAWWKLIHTAYSRVFPSLFLFSISSALRWALQDHWSSGYKNLTESYQISLKYLPYLTDFSSQLMACM